MTRLLLCLFCAACFVVASSTQAALGQVITGTVTVTPGHQPVERAIVTLKGKQLTAVTRTDGSYTLSNVAPGVYTVIASKVHYYSSMQESVASGQRANLELLEVKYANTGKLVVADLDEAQAQHLLPAAELAGDSEAVFVLSNRLLASHPDDVKWQQKSVTAQRALESKPTKISGTITDVSGARVPNADVHVNNTITGETIDTKTDSSGQYQVSVFPVGAYSVKASWRGQESVAVLPAHSIAMNADVTKDILVRAPELN